MKTKRVFSLLLCAALIVALLPTAALAAGTGSFAVTGDTSGYSYADHTLTFNADAAGKNFTVSMAPGVELSTADKIIVNGGTSDQPVSIKLNSIHINQTYAGGYAFELASNSVVDLTLRGDNALISGKNCAGLRVTEGATVNISEDSATPAADSLTANGGYFGAGIGGDINSVYNGTVVINSGTVTAIGGGLGAGIGSVGNSTAGTVVINGGTVTANGGVRGAGLAGTITITGGSVTANGGYNGFGIGGDIVTITGGTVAANGSYNGAGIGGAGSNGGTVYISGGSVHAIGGDNAEAIGKGNGGSSSGTLQNSGTALKNVYLATLTLPGITEKTTVSSLKVSMDGENYDYGAKDIQTDSHGRLYLYLPEGSCNLQMTAGAYSYAAELTISSAGTNAVTVNDLSSTNITIDTPGTYVLTGTSASNKISVSGGTETDPVNITLDGVTVYQFATDPPAQSVFPFNLKSGSFVNLTLSGYNGLYGTYSALHVPDGATLTIGGGGSLEAAAVDDACSAGIGGARDENGGNITINGGTLTATGGYAAAGIGGGMGGAGGTVTINDGTIIAASTANNYGSSGAGIGGGLNGDGGAVTITGGTVIANHYDMGSGDGAGIGGGFGGDGGTVTITGGTVIAGNHSGHGAGIGGGAGGSGGKVYISGGSVSAASIEYVKDIGAGNAGPDNGTLQNSSSEQIPVYLTTVNLQDTTGAAVGDRSVSSLTASLNGSAYAYGAKDMQSDSDGKLYLYLPENTGTTAAQAVGNSYLGSVSTSADSAASSGTLTLSSISGVTPGGTGTPISGSLVISFMEEMDSSVTGTVSLNGGAALTGGVWSVGNTVYTIPYSGLSYSTAYTVAVSSFRSAAGITIASDNTHGFVTMDEPISSGGGDGKAYYTITATAGTGGSISPTGKVSVTGGDDKTYTITPIEGYEIKDVLVDGVSVGAVGTYTFENIKKAHTITASFSGKKTVNPFTDVDSSEWFYDNVMYVYENGLMNGTASDSFCPNSGMTRSMFVTVLYRLSGDTGSYTGYFTDIPSGEWYENAVAWAVKNGIAGGVGDNKFAPDMGISREQLAVVLYRYAKYKGYDVSVGKDTNILSYKDALSISDYACSALQWACGAGIMNGDNGYLNPNGPASRAQVAAMLQRFVENVVG